jgi:nucleoside phosphorylase
MSNQYRDSSSGCSTIPFTPFHNGSKTSEIFDIGVIIALEEEFSTFQKTVQSSQLWEKPPRITQKWCNGRLYYQFFLLPLRDNNTSTDNRPDFNDTNEVSVVVRVMNGMGTERAGLETAAIIDNFKLSYLVNIGLTGSLDKDLPVGSILIPTEVTHYFANWKAKDSEAVDNHEFLIGTQSFPISTRLIDEVSAFKSSPEYLEWQNLCMATDNKHPVPIILFGHLASANVVVDSKIFKQKLKDHDRKLMACEMETAGIMLSDLYLDSPTRITTQIICIRCISDMAANKATSELTVSSELAVSHAQPTRQVTGGDVANNGGMISKAAMNDREIALCNATNLFLSMIKTKVINAHCEERIIRIQEFISSLSDKKKAAKQSIKDRQSVVATYAEFKTKFSGRIENLKDFNKEQLDVLRTHFGFPKGRGKQVDIMARMTESGFVFKGEGLRSGKEVSRKQVLKDTVVEDDEDELNTAEDDADGNNDDDDESIDDETIGSPSIDGSLYLKPTDFLVTSLGPKKQSSSSTLQTLPGMTSPYSGRDGSDYLIGEIDSTVQICFEPLKEDQTNSRVKKSPVDSPGHYADAEKQESPLKKRKIVNQKQQIIELLSRSLTKIRNGNNEVSISPYTDSDFVTVFGNLESQLQLIEDRFIIK